MKKLLFVLLLFSSGFAVAQLSEQSRISLLTCSAGDEVYEKFGHCGLRICDSTLNLDVVFHYGVFDFDTEFFIPKFIKGATDYSIGLIPTRYFLALYTERKSSVTEQTLSLDLTQRQQLFDALRENYKPENRLYRYNFVFDNCATRPFNMVMQTIDKPTLCSYSIDKTYRDIVHECVGWENWTAFGIALLLGSEADRKTGNEGAIGFPFCMRDKINATWIQTAPDTIVPLVSNEKTLIAFPSKPIEATPNYFAPDFIFALLALLGMLLTWYDHKHRRQTVWIDSILFGIVGIIGVVLFYLMVFSLHPLVHGNWNIIWANPLFLLFAIIAPIKKCTKSKQHLAFGLNIILIGGMITQFTPIQTFHSANIFFTILMLVRLVPYLQIKNYNSNLN